MPVSGSSLDQLLPPICGLRSITRTFSPSSAAILSAMTAPKSRRRLPGISDPQAPRSLTPHSLGTDVPAIMDPVPADGRDPFIGLGNCLRHRRAQAGDTQHTAAICDKTVAILACAGVKDHEIRH